MNAVGQSVTVTGNTGRAGSITVAAGDQITCTFTNNHSPKLSITKEPDQGDPGSVINPGGTATFTVTVSNAADGGPATDVVLTDTLPNELNWSENPETLCTIPGALAASSGCSSATLGR